MTVAAASAAAASAAAYSVSSGRARLAENFDTFLTLLTTQMRNQDPLAPLDSNQFTAQLVQMTGVEQQLATNDLLKQLVANSGTSIASAVDLIGKQVRADGAEARLSGGKAQWSYHLDANTSDLTISVLNAKGDTVDVIAPSAADSKAGEHSFTWNGRNLAGQALPDGLYSLKLSTKSASGDTVETGQVYREGAVTAVEQTSGQTLLTIGGAKIPLSQVTSVSQPPAPSVTTTTMNTNSTTNPADQTSAAAA
jgi:flagellar basal-body rod modification protein FlgD